MKVLKMLRSFKYAFNGVGILIQENNTRFHLLATIIACLSGVYLGLSHVEWVLILIQIGLVLGAEAFNTAIEKLCNFVSPTHHTLIGQVKDLAAAGVLITSCIAAIIGIVIFLPKILAII